MTNHGAHTFLQPVTSHSSANQLQHVQGNVNFITNELNSMITESDMSMKAIESFLLQTDDQPSTVTSFYNHFDTVGEDIHNIINFKLPLNDDGIYNDNANDNDDESMRSSDAKTFELLLEFTEKNGFL
jgi:hypothetical protein